MVLISIKWGYKIDKWSVLENKWLIYFNIIKSLFIIYLLIFVIHLFGYKKINEFSIYNYLVIVFLFAILNTLSLFHPNSTRF
jgi:hypothetical protein